MSPLQTNSAHGKIILGVDDQPENIVMLESILESQGFRFFGASSGAECLNMVQRTRPHVILLDVQMPGMDGFETCRRLRAMPEYRHIPIAFLTAHKEVEDIKTGVAVGGNDFIGKPFDPNRLANRVRHWANRQVSA